jgi:deoxyadenosine/deoxycytidine kinase
MQKLVRICIDGIIGAGKSTLIQKLKKDFTCFEEPIERWSLLPSLYSNMKRFVIPFQFQVLLSQYDQYMSFKNINDIIIVERCPWTSKNVFSQKYVDNGLFDKASILTYHKFFESLSYEVDYFIYLDVEPELAWKRVKARDCYGESNISS